MDRTAQLLERLRWRYQRGELRGEVVDRSSVSVELDISSTVK